MIRRSLRVARALARPHVLAIGAMTVGAVTLGAQNRIPVNQAQGHYQRGERLFADAQYRDAYDAFQRTLATNDQSLTLLATKGKIRAALRLAQFQIANREAEALNTANPDDLDALTLRGDSLWGLGLFDEAEHAYKSALERFPNSARARFGVARSLATRGRTEEALAEAQAASATDPEDVEVLALVGDMYERLYRFDEAAAAYERCVALLPKRLRKDSNVAPSKVKLLRSFSGREAVTIEGDPNQLHRIPFKLTNKKIVLDGVLNGRSVQLILDTGAERTTISKSTADRSGVRGVTETIITGVGSPGILKMGVARVDSLEIGTLKVRNFPVSVRGATMPGIPRWQNETFSPLALGLSVVVDYQRNEVTFGRVIPDNEQVDVRLPMRVYRLPMVRGLLNDTHPAYFVVDTGGEMMSISTEIANQLRMPQTRRIALRVWGIRGLDRDAFLLPGVDLDFNTIEYRKQGLAVLNLRAPSVLLGFQVGGILGHKFLAPYRVAMDMSRGELRLQRN